MAAGRRPAGEAEEGVARRRTTILFFAGGRQPAARKRILSRLVEGPYSWSATSRRRRGLDGSDYFSCVSGLPVYRRLNVHVLGTIFPCILERSFVFLRHTSMRSIKSEKKHRTPTCQDPRYGKLAPTTEPTLLIDILMAGESAVRCLDLPCSISMAAAVKVAAKKFLAENYSHPFKILNCLGVESEGSIYDFVLRWACSHFTACLDALTWGPNPPMVPRVPRAGGATDGVLIDHPLFPSPSGVMRLQSFHCAGRSFLLLSRINWSHQAVVLDGHVSVWVVVLGRHFCPSRFKRMRVNEMGRRVGVALRRGVGCMIPWSKFIARKDTHFIDDMFHVRVHVKITSPVVVMAKWTNLT
ncbi:hypothetical protein ZWY2020_020530 [Hordeum vulgare]|nr:hypothetical protein ZWY2020_020530 [Hordeum vulgare]